MPSKPVDPARISYIERFQETLPKPQVTLCVEEEPPNQHGLSLNDILTNEF